MDLQIKVLQITPEMVGRHLLIRGASVEHMFAEDAFGAAPQAEGDAAGSDEEAYEIPPGMSNADVVLDWIVRYVTDAKGRKVTITELRDALPQGLIKLYASPSSARGSVASAVKKGVDSEILVSSGFGAEDSVKKAPRKRKPKPGEEVAENAKSESKATEKDANETAGGDNDESDFVPNGDEAESRQPSPAVEPAPTVKETAPVATSRQDGAERSASDRPDINDGIEIGQFNIE